MYFQTAFTIDHYHLSPIQSHIQPPVHLLISSVHLLQMLKTMSYKKLFSVFYNLLKIMRIKTKWIFL
jgi:hypothetical protein